MLSHNADNLIAFHPREFSGAAEAQRSGYTSFNNVQNSKNAHLCEIGKVSVKACFGGRGLSTLNKILKYVSLYLVNCLCINSMCFVMADF